MSSIQILPVARQGRGAFNGGEIVENRPIVYNSLPATHPYSNLFYWAHAKAVTDSTIGLHPHQGFEICSFILKGPVRHYDTKLQDWRPLNTGDVQIIRSGSGISHSEFMGEGSEMFQIWFDPSLEATLRKPATYDDYRSDSFPVDNPAQGVTRKTIVGPGSPMQMDTPGIAVFRVTLQEASYPFEADPEKVYSAYVISGSVNINGEVAQTSEFAVLRDQTLITLEAAAAAEVFFIASPAKPGYLTYAEG